MDANGARNPRTSQLFAARRKPAPPRSPDPAAQAMRCPGRMGDIDEQRTCPNCGEPVADTDTVCPNCGETLVGG